MHIAKKKKKAVSKYFIDLSKNNISGGNKTSAFILVTALVKLYLNEST